MWWNSGSRYNTRAAHRHSRFRRGQFRVPRLSGASRFPRRINDLRTKGVHQARDQTRQAPIHRRAPRPGTFLMDTTEFVIAGLLPDLAADLGVTVARAGLLITAFGVGMIVGAPTISVATARLPRRLTLVLALVHLCRRARRRGGQRVVRDRVRLLRGHRRRDRRVPLRRRRRRDTAAGPERGTRAMGVM